MPVRDLDIPRGISAFGNISSAQARHCWMDEVVHTRSSNLKQPEKFLRWYRRIRIFRGPSPRGSGKDKVFNLATFSQRPHAEWATPNLQKNDFLPFLAFDFSISLSNLPAGDC